jgi:hypothetical protein
VSGTECAKASGTERWLAPIGTEMWLAPIAVAVLDPNQTMSMKAAPKSRTTPWSAGPVAVLGHQMRCRHSDEAKRSERWLAPIGGEMWLAPIAILRFLLRTKRCP